MRRNTQFACLLAGALVALAPSSASAQMPPDIAAKIKEIGRVIDPPKTAPIYAPLQQKEPYVGVKVARDLKYGPDARNALDVFTPENATGPLPVYIFVHGGGFVAGNKRGPNNSPFYDNFMLWAAKNGMVGVNATYRLAPANPWPAAPQDIAAAVKWVRDNIASHGGDPQPDLPRRQFRGRRDRRGLHRRPEALSGAEQYRRQRRACCSPGPSTSKASPTPAPRPISAKMPRNTPSAHR